MPINPKVIVFSILRIKELKYHDMSSFRRTKMRKNRLRENKTSSRKFLSRQKQRNPHEVELDFMMSKRDMDYRNIILEDIDLNIIQKTKICQR